MSVVVFDYALWATQFPQLAASVTEGQAQFYFDQAELYIDNTDCSIICDEKERRILLYLLVAHLAQLAIRGAETGNVAGRITNATQGSVNVGFGMTAGNATAEWYGQTSFGNDVYAALAKYRTARYVPAPVRVSAVWPLMRRRGLRGY